MKRKFTKLDVTEVFGRLADNDGEITVWTDYSGLWAEVTLIGYDPRLKDRHYIIKGLPVGLYTVFDRELYLGDSPSSHGWHNPLPPSTTSNQLLRAIEKCGFKSAPEKVRMLCRDEIGTRAFSDGTIRTPVGGTCGTMGERPDLPYFSTQPYGQLPKVIKHTFPDCAPTRYELPSLPEPPLLSWPNSLPRSALPDYKVATCHGEVVADQFKSKSAALDYATELVSLSTADRLFVLGPIAYAGCASSTKKFTKDISYEWHTEH